MDESMQGARTGSDGQGKRRGARFLSSLARLYGLDKVAKYAPVVWILSAGTVLSYLGRGAAYPFIALYLTTTGKLAPSVEASLAIVAGGIALEQAVRALTSPVFGGLSDRYGRKPLMLVGLALQAVTVPLYLFVDGPLIYFAVSIVAGLGQAPYQPALSAFLADVTPPEQRSGVFGLVHMTKNLGMSLGVAAGSLLVTHSYTVLFIAGGLMPLAYALVVFTLVREPVMHAASARKVHPLRSATAAFRSPVFVAFLAAAAFVFVSWGQLESVLPVFIKDGLGLSPRWVSAAFLVNSGLVVLFQVPVGEHAGRLPRAAGLAFAGVLTAVGFVAMGAAGYAAGVGEVRAAQLLLLGAMGIITLAEMVETPLLFSLAAELAPPNMTGGAMGVLALVAPLGMGAAPLIAGGVGAALGWPWVWGAFALLLLMGAAAFLGVGHLARRTQPAGATPAAASAPEPVPVVPAASAPRGKKGG